MCIATSKLPREPQLNYLLSVTNQNKAQVRTASFYEGLRLHSNSELLVCVKLWQQSAWRPYRTCMVLKQYSIVCKCPVDH